MVDSLVWKPRGIIGGKTEGPQGPAGPRGGSVRIATYDVLSGSSVPISKIQPNEDISEGDIIIDAKGQAYFVTAVSKNFAQVSDWTGVSLKGKDGKGEKGDRGASVHVTSKSVVENSAVDYQFFSQADDVRRGDVVMDKNGALFEITDVNQESKVAYVGGKLAEIMPEVQSGLKDAKVNDAGHLVITMQDGSTIDAGQVRGGMLRFGKGGPPVNPVAGDTWIDVLTGDCYQVESR